VGELHCRLKIGVVRVDDAVDFEPRLVNRLAIGFQVGVVLGPELGAVKADLFQHLELVDEGEVGLFHHVEFQPVF